MGIVQDQADLDRCPHLEARGMFVDVGTEVGGTFRTVNTPIKIAGSVGTPNRQPPLLGEHNKDILCSIGGISLEELSDLAAENKI